MHRDTLSHVAVTQTNYIVTGSVDGHVKFWKKQPEGIEFVKHFRAHLGEDGKREDGSESHLLHLCCNLSLDL